MYPAAFLLKPIAYTVIEPTRSEEFIQVSNGKQKKM